MKKNIFTRGLKAITHPRLLAGYLLNKFASRIYDDRKYIKWKYWLTFGEHCDLDNPKTFQEKLQWIKLNDRKPIYHQMVDKYDVKKFIAERVGEEYVIPTLGIWDRSNATFTTLGLSPPLALRNVAILFTFTLNFVI